MSPVSDRYGKRLKKTFNTLMDKLSQIYKYANNVIRLKDVAELTAGYYPTNSRIFTLKDCSIIRSNLIKGYSDVLQQYISVEKDALRPIISPSKVQDFVDADYQHYSTYLITANYKALYFETRYPLTARYLIRCEEYLRGGAVSWSDALMRSYLQEAIDRQKVIISTSGDNCHAMLDVKKNVVSTLTTYLCSFPYADIQTYKAYLAIFNSQLFSYLFFYEIKEARKHNISRIRMLSDMLVPRKSEDFAILENISDCLLFMSRPDIPQLSYRISNDRLAYYLKKILDMVVYELYFAEYVFERGLDVIRYMIHAPFMLTMMREEDRILETYAWFQRPDNIIRQKLSLLDTRSPEFLYKIQTFVPDEQD